jgi:hypothetical protein
MEMLEAGDLVLLGQWSLTIRPGRAWPTWPESRYCLVVCQNDYLAADASGFPIYYFDILLPDGTLSRGKCGKLLKIVQRYRER